MRWIRFLLHSYIPFLISFVVGIYIYSYDLIYFHVFLYMSAFVFFLFHRCIGMLCLLLLVCCDCGWCLRYLKEKTFDDLQGEIASYTHHRTWLEGIVVSHPVPSNRQYSYTMRVQQILEKDHWQDVDFQMGVSSKTYQSPEKGDQIQIFSKPFVFNPVRIIQKIKNIHAYAVVFENSDWKMIEEKKAWSTLLRKRILDTAKLHLSSMSYQYFRVMAFGDQALLDSETLSRLKQTGLLHLFVISGYHIAFVWKLGFIFFRSLWGWYPVFHRKKNFFLWVELAAIGFVMGFLSLINSPVSTFRAVGSMVLFLLLKALRRDQHPMWSLGVVFFAMLVANPLLLFDVSTQLTFASVAGILLFSHGLNAWLLKQEIRTILAYLLKIVAVTLGAACFTMPVLYFHFGSFYPVSVLYNLVVGSTLGSIISFLSVAAVVWSVPHIEFIHQIGFLILDFLFGFFSRVLFWKVETPLYTLSPLISSYSTWYWILAGILSGILLSLNFYRKRKEMIR